MVCARHNGFLRSGPESIVPLSRLKERKHINIVSSPASQLCSLCRCIQFDSTGFGAGASCGETQDESRPFSVRDYLDATIQELGTGICFHRHGIRW
jgi:hypothetical protein